MRKHIYTASREKLIDKMINDAAIKHFQQEISLYNMTASSNYICENHDIEKVISNHSCLFDRASIEPTELLIQCNIILTAD